MMKIKEVAITKTGLASGQPLVIFKVKGAVEQNGADYNECAKVLSIVEALSKMTDLKIPITLPDSDEEIGYVEGIDILDSLYESASIHGRIRVTAGKEFWDLLPREERMRITPVISYITTKHFPILDGPIDIIKFTVTNRLIQKSTGKALPMKPVSKITFDKPPPQFLGKRTGRPLTKSK